MKKISSIRFDIKKTLGSEKIYFFIGSAVSQIFALATSLYILSYASADVYGRFSFFISIALIIGSLSTLKFEQSIVISENQQGSQDKFNLTFQTSIICSVISIIVLLTFFNKFSLIEYALFFILSISICLFASLQQCFLFLNKHLLNGLLISTYAFLNFIFVLLLLGKNNGLEISYSFAYLMTCLVFCIVAINQQYFPKLLSFSLYKKLFVNNRSYVQLLLPGAVFTIILTYAHPIIIKLIYSETEVGLFSVSLRILLLPSIVIGTVVSGLLRAKLSVLFFEKEYQKVLKEAKTILNRLLIASLLIFPILGIAINNLDLLVDLTNWKGISAVALMLLMYAVAQFFFIPLSNIALVCNEKSLLFKFSIAQFLITAFVYAAAYYFRMEFYNFLLLLSASTLVFSLYAVYKFISLPKKFLC